MKTIDLRGGDCSRLLGHGRRVDREDPRESACARWVAAEAGRLAKEMCAKHGHDFGAPTAEACLRCGIIDAEFREVDAAPPAVSAVPHTLSTAPVLPTQVLDALREIRECALQAIREGEAEGLAQDIFNAAEKGLDGFDL